MQLAMALFQYFPYGGLTRDLMQFARVALDRGHTVGIYTMRMAGPIRNHWPEVPGLVIHCVQPPGWTRYHRYHHFGTWVRACAGPDTVLWGFNTMSHLDVYYGADICLSDKYPVGTRWEPRRRALLNLEAQVWGPGGPPLIFTMSERQNQIYARHYPQPRARCITLPPGIRTDCTLPAAFAPYRTWLRTTYRLPPNAQVLLCMGSGFRTKGVDRAIRLLAQLAPACLEQTYLVVVGEDQPGPFQRLAAQLGVGARVVFTGGVSDVLGFYAGADLLLHLAYYENAGMAIAEALIAGLPVGVTRQCGYAHFVAEHAHQGAGWVWDEPLDLAVCARTVETYLAHPQHKKTWEHAAAALSADPQMRAMHTQAIACIEAAWEAGCFRRPVG